MSYQENSPHDYLKREQKERVLQTSPLLAEYVADTDKREWNQSVEEYSEKYLNTFEQALGPDWFRFTITPLLALATTNNVFIQSPDVEQQARAAAQLVFMGAEIGNDLEMVKEFVPDVTKSFEQLAVVNADGTFPHLITEFVRVGLLTGLCYSKINRVPQSIKINQQTSPQEKGKLSAFEDLINSLDLDDFTGKK